MAKVKTKAKTKRWYKIVAPSCLKNANVGETLAAEPNELIGRYVDTNLRNVTGNIKLQNINVKLRITSVKDRTAQSEIVSYTFLHTALKRFVKRRIDRIDESFIVVTKDNIKIRIKPLLLTRFNAKKSAKRGLRAGLKKQLTDRVKKLSYNDFVRIILYNRLQKEISKKLNKIYPVRFLLLREFHLVEEEEKQDSKEVKDKKAEVVKKETKENKPEEKSKKTKKTESTKKKD
ncbi:MAG: 30S ribosomal protein S3Ae [Candidatus Woesearchaeota archaeon]|nr:30S ribosomal protein S3Ae [Candidatus Woesearchaeota archaeon]